MKTIRTLRVDKTKPQHKGKAMQKLDLHRELHDCDEHIITLEKQIEDDKDAFDEIGLDASFCMHELQGRLSDEHHKKAFNVLARIATFAYEKAKVL